MSEYRDKALNRRIGQAIHRYQMIEDGDLVAVAVSGGADSLCLWQMMEERRRRAPIDYRVIGIHIDPGFPLEDSSRKRSGEELRDYAKSMSYDFYYESSDIGPRAHEEGKKNPCFHCSRARRKRLFHAHKELGCSKLALGHNKDDIIETFFINLCQMGEVSTMVPKQELFSGAVSLIRPLAFADQKEIRAYAKNHSLPIIPSRCPSDGSSKRSFFRNFLSELQRQNKKSKGNIFRALHRDRINLDFLL